MAKEDMYIRDGLHLSGKGAGVFADGLKQCSNYEGKRTGIRGFVEQLCGEGVYVYEGWSAS